MPTAPQPPGSVGEPAPSSTGPREPAVDGVLVEDPPDEASFDPRAFSEGASPYSLSNGSDDARPEHSSVAGAVAKVATAAVVVGGLVGITYLVTRERKTGRR